MSAKRTGMLEGWSLTLLLALGVAAMALGLIAWQSQGTDNSAVDGVRMAIRATARTSLALFSLAFAAGGLLRLWPNAFTQWLRRNRRYVGVGFAASHGVHLAAIIAFAMLDMPQFRQATSLGSFVFGGLGYAFILAMTATSFDRTAAWVGPRVWKGLHTVGVYYLWLQFMVSGGMRATHNPSYWLYAMVLLAAMAVRHGSKLRRVVPALR